MIALLEHSTQMQIAVFLVILHVQLVGVTLNFVLHATNRKFFMKMYAMTHALLLLLKIGVQMFALVESSIKIKTVLIVTRGAKLA